MSKIKLTYLRVGASRFLSAAFDLFESPIDSFLIGTEYGFDVVPNETIPRGQITFTGGTQHVRSKLDNDDRDLQVTLIVPEGPDVTVGNVVVYARHNGIRQPALSIVMPEPIVKRDAFPDALQAEGTHHPGNRLLINFTVKYVEGELDGEVIVHLVTPSFASPPIFGDLEEVPAPDLNPHNQFVVNRMGENDRPAIVTRGHDGQYFASPLYQDLNDPRYGILNGGVQGHPETRDRWICSGRYPRHDRPDDAYTLIGSSYDVEEGMTIVGGDSY